LRLGEIGARAQDFHVPARVDFLQLPQQPQRLVLALEIGALGLVVKKAERGGERHGSGGKQTLARELPRQ